MPVLDFVLNTLGVLENIFSAAIVAILTYMICGGWKFVFRAVSFFFDTQLVKLIGTVFSYFNQLLTMEMFSKELMDELLRNIYVFIGVIMFFRLMMLVIKYLINPDMINDAKAGVSSLIQRVVIGCCGILFIPTIFNLANELQVAILEDGIIQQLIIPHDMIDQMEDKINQGGHYIGTYVLAGFLSPNSSASSADVKQFDLGVQQGDLSNIDINEGGFLTQKFKYDYFFFISTLALGYVFYYMLKYCIDIAGRCFKLLLYKLIAPIAMIEYMINGSQDGVFKQWLSATISTYAMLFVRILAIWFVLLVTTLMGDEGGAYAGELLTNNDYFLRAIIIIALLGFMMDLPKLVGQIFGLDLEQEGSASGVLKQVGGMVKGAAIGALAVGGAAAGSLAGDLGGLSAARRQAKAQTKADEAMNPDGQKFSKAEFNQRRNQHLKENLAKMDGGQMFRNSGAGILSAAMGANQFTNAFAGSFSNNKKANQSVGESMESQEISKAKSKQTEEDRHNQIVGNQRVQIDNQDKEMVMNVTARMADSGLQVGPAEVAAKVRPTEVASCDAQIQGSIATVAATTLSASDVQADGSISASAQAPLRREVEEVVTRTYESQGVDTSLPSVQQTITQQVDQVMGSAVASVDATGTVSLSVDTSSISASAVGMGDQTITQVVNQVQGTKVGAETLEATQLINQQLGQVIDNTGITASAVTQQVDIQRTISDTVNESVEVQKDIRYNTGQIDDNTRSSRNATYDLLREVREINDKDEHGNPL